MKWEEVSITTTECMLDAVTNIFYEIGAGGVVIEDPRVVSRYLQNDVWDYYELPKELLQAENVVIKGYLPVNEKLTESLEELQNKLKNLENYFEDYSGEISTNQICEEDWENAWKAYYKPHKIGKRIIIVPSWEDYKIEEGELPIYLDPGMAFGTGTHPTTELCILALEDYLQENDSVYDIGTGSGILAISAAKMGAGSITALDIDDLAVKIAVKNIKNNNVEKIIKAEKGNLLNGKTVPANVITANIIADVIIELIQQAYKLLLPNGKFICSGIISERKNDVKERLIRAGFDILRLFESSGWTAIVAQRK
jgi:ribosomal protein L11 methyltransferase